MIEYTVEALIEKNGEAPLSFRFATICNLRAREGWRLDSWNQSSQPQDGSWNLTILAIFTKEVRALTDERLPARQPDRW